MKFNITLNQPNMIKYNLNVTQYAILDVLSVAPTWTDTIIIDQEVYYWVARQKIAEELLAFNLKADTIYRHIKTLAEMELLDYKKSGRKDCIRLSKKAKKMFSSTMSEINPSYYVGNKSESNSEINPTYKDTIPNNNTNNIYMSSGDKKFTFKLKRKSQFDNLSQEYQEELEKYAIEYFTQHQVPVEEYENFKDYSISQGKARVDWSASIRTWKINYYKFNQNNSNYQQNQNQTQKTNDGEFYGHCFNEYGNQ